MNISQRIEAAQSDRTRLRDMLTVLIGKDEPTDEETLQIDELNLQIPAIEKQLETLKTAEKNLAIKAVTDPPARDGEIILPNQPGRPFAIPMKKIEPFDLMLRAAICTGLAHYQKRSAMDILKERYNNDEATGIVLRAAVNPAMTTVVGWAAELVQIITDGFLSTLQPISVYARMRAAGISLTFDRAGLLKIPSRSATPMINGDFVGEGAPIPVRRIGFGSITLTPKKVAVISTFTEEMADHSTPQIEGLLREAITEDTALILDTRLLDAAAATAIRPAGLRNGVAALTPSVATDSSEAMVEDLRALIGALTAVNGGRRIVIILNTAQSMSIGFARTGNGEFLFSGTDEAGRKFNVTFIPSNNVTAGTVIAVDVADFVSVSGDTPQFDMSNQATIHEEDTTPLPIVNGAGLAAAPVRSLWQTDSMGLRMRMPVNWAMRRTGMVSWMENVTW